MQLASKVFYIFPAIQIILLEQKTFNFNFNFSKI